MERERLSEWEREAERERKREKEREREIERERERERERGERERERERERKREGCKRENPDWQTPKGKNWQKNHDGWHRNPAKERTERKWTEKKWIHSSKKKLKRKRPLNLTVNSLSTKTLVLCWAKDVPASLPFLNLAVQRMHKAVFLVGHATRQQDLSSINLTFKHCCLMAFSILEQLFASAEWKVGEERGSFGLHLFTPKRNNFTSKTNKFRRQPRMAQIAPSISFAVELGRDKQCFSCPALRDGKHQSLPETCVR